MKFKKKEPKMRIPQLNSVWIFRGEPFYVSRLWVGDKGVIHVEVRKVTTKKGSGLLMSLDSFLDDAKPVLDSGKQRVLNV